MKSLVISFLSIIISMQAAMAQDIDKMLFGMKTDREKADTLIKLSHKIMMNGKFDSAGSLLKIAWSFAQKSGDDEIQARYYVDQGNLYLLMLKFTEGLQLFRNVYTRLIDIPSYDLRNKYLLLYGMLFEKSNQTDSALYYYHQCELLNNRENPYRNWLVYIQIAIMFQNVDAFEESEKYFKKSYELAKSKAIRYDYGVVISQFADLYYQWNKPDKFAMMIKEQEDFINSRKRDFTKDPVHSMFFIDWGSKQFDKKISFMLNVKNELLKGGSQVNGAMANNYLALFYEMEKQPAEALKYIKENQQMFGENNDIISLYINTKIAYRLAKKTGKSEEIVVEADKLIALRDSIIRLQQRESMMELQTKFETEKKENDIVLLNTESRLKSLKLTKEMELKNALIRENHLKDSVVTSEKEYSKLLGKENELRKSQLEDAQELKAAISRENTLKGKQLSSEKKLTGQLMAFGSLLFLCGLVILFMYNRQRRKNKIIQKQADDLQTLMKEIHHRVKNNLQVISSLLDLQSMSIKDKQAAGAVKEGKMRVQSMALIHQNLYSEGNIKGILMEDYIKKLAENLFHSYNIRKDKIQLIMDVDDLNLDVDTVIPLGLIMNELITNSLKYAFKEKDHGEICVSLRENNKRLELLVRDNGCGFPPHLNQIKNDSFGFGLVNAFAQKLKAKLDIYNNGGACVAMNILRYKRA